MTTTNAKTNMDTSPLRLLDLPVEIQEMIYDYFFRSESHPYEGQKVVQLMIGGAGERPSTTVSYPNALLQTSRAVRNIAAPLLSKGLTLDVKSWRGYNLNQVADVLPAPYLPRFSELTMRVETETPHAVDLSKFSSLEKATFDLRRVLDTRVYMSLHLPALDTIKSTRLEVAETLRDWRSWYPQYFEGNMKSMLFDWLHHIGQSVPSEETTKEVRASSSYYFDIEIRDCETTSSQPFDRVRFDFEVTRKLRMDGERRFWDTESIYIIDPSLPPHGAPGDESVPKSIQAKNVVQVLTEQIGQHYPTIEVKSALSL